ncbi:hypothetical protein OsI_32970 [Oryza sativa Indica Group]|uniref:Uncharacterized protein n=1 Tax=Oryza sativa subsp. indica TaxID=39946 RepID=B8BG22_ORYSI|nr:hypothetical protein OsI_32970 [Oryza sativa Indica Group]
MPWLALLFAAADGDDGPAAAVRKGLRFDAVPSLVAFGGHDGGVFAREVRMDGGRGARRRHIPVHGGEARGAGARCGQRGRNGGLAGQATRMSSGVVVEGVVMASTTKVMSTATRCSSVGSLDFHVAYRPGDMDGHVDRNITPDDHTIFHYHENKVGGTGNIGGKKDQ